MGRKLRELTIKDDFSVGVQGEIRLKPRISVIFSVILPCTPTLCLVR